MTSDKQQAATPRTDEIAAVMRSMNNTSGETYFALRDAAIAGIEALETALTERTEQLAVADAEVIAQKGIASLYKAEKEIAEAEVARLKDLSRFRKAVEIAAFYTIGAGEDELKALLTEIDQSLDGKEKT